MNDSEKWTEAISNGDTLAVAELLKKRSDFPFLEAKDLNYWGIKYKTIWNDNLSKIYYYCLNENRNLSNKQQTLKYYYNNDLVNLFYHDEEFNNIYGNNIFYLSSKNRNYQEDVTKIRDSIRVTENQISNNLNILKYIIHQRQNVTVTEAMRMVYPAGADESEWGIESQSFFFFYKDIFPNSNLFSSTFDPSLFSYDRIFRSYVSNTMIDEKLILFLLDNIQDKASVWPMLYPEIETEEWNRDLAETLPSYEAEVILMTEYPEIADYSGYNLLHAAIVNVDLDRVKKLSHLVDKSTNPIHPYLYNQFGKEPLSPLELAKFKQGQWIEEFKNDKEGRSVSKRFRLNRIQKIINYLKYGDENFSFSVLL